MINSGNYNSASNIKAYWKFNSGEGDILYDHSGNANHGTLNGPDWKPFYNGPKWYVSSLGSDNNIGSIDFPFASIQAGIDEADEGDTVYVQGYNGVFRATIYDKRSCS